MSFPFEWFWWWKIWSSVKVRRYIRSPLTLFHFEIFLSNPYEHFYSSRSICFKGEIRPQSAMYKQRRRQFLKLDINHMDLLLIQPIQRNRPLSPVRHSPEFYHLEDDDEFSSSPFNCEWSPAGVPVRPQWGKQVSPTLTCPDTNLS